MRILILDDDVERHRMFKRALAGHTVRHSTSFEEFEKDVVSFRPDVVYLDYDLNYQNPDHSVLQLSHGEKVMNGADAAKILARTHRPRLVVIHSRNRRGAREIEKVLKASGIRSIRKPIAELFGKTFVR